MDHFDDIQIEEFSSFDFVEEMNEGLFEEKEDNKSFDAFLKSNCDFWLWHLIHSIFKVMQLQFLDL